MSPWRGVLPAPAHGTLSPRAEREKNHPYCTWSSLVYHRRCERTNWLPKQSSLCRHWVCAAPATHEAAIRVPPLRGALSSSWADIIQLLHSYVHIIRCSCWSNIDIRRCETTPGSYAFLWNIRTRVRAVTQKCCMRICIYIYIYIYTCMNKQAGHYIYIYIYI